MKDPEHIIDGILIDDPLMSDADRRTIRILSPDEARAIWRELISLAGWHLKLLPDDAWPSQWLKTPISYAWEADWNADQSWPLSDWISSLRSELAPIHVFWGQSTGVEVPNGDFARNWVNFLYEDEGCLVVARGDDRRCVFSNGHFWVLGGD